jgi:DNA-binding HxlR family transcriptional regulator
MHLRTTLNRLERDGLVEVAGAADAEGRVTYGITARSSAARCAT